MLIVVFLLVFILLTGWIVREFWDGTKNHQDMSRNVSTALQTQLINELPDEQVIDKEISKSDLRDLIWYEPSNNASDKGSLPDFEQLFNTTGQDQWQSARSRTGVLVLRGSTLSTMEAEAPGFIRNTVAFLNKSGMRLGLDMTGATYASCVGEVRRNERMKHDKNVLQQIEKAGGNVQYIMLQSTFSKLPHESSECDYTIEKREQDIDWYIREIKEKFPNGQALTASAGMKREIKFGLIDSLAAKDDHLTQEILGVPGVSAAYKHLLDYEKKQGNVIDFFVLDCPVEHVREFNNMATGSFRGIRESLQQFQKEGIAAGVILTSAQSKTEEDFNKNVLWYANGLHAHDILPDFYMLASWFSIPLTELPERVDKNRAAIQYPMTRVLKHLSYYVLRYRLNNESDTIPLNRYLDKNAYDHRDFSRELSSKEERKYKVGGQLGIIMQNSSENKELIPLFSCITETNDYFTSTDENCEGATLVERLGYVWTMESINRKPVYRCSRNIPGGMKDRFSTGKGDCEAERGNIENNGKPVFYVRKENL